MATVKFETSDKPHLTVTDCLGRLTVTGSDVRQVVVEVEGEAEDLVTRREGEAITLSALRDCYITCPPETSLTVQQVMGKLRVRGIDGPLAVKAVMGGVSLRDIGPAMVQSAMGDLDARHVKGDLSLEQVRGDLRLRSLEGQVLVRHCAGDLDMRDVVGGAEVHSVLGDVVLSSALTPGREYRVQAAGDIRARIPADSSVRCVLEADGDVRCSLPLSGGDKTPHRITGQLGAGEAFIELHARGDVTLKSEAQEPEADVVHISAALEAQMAEIEQRLQEKLAGLGEISVHLGDKMQRRAEKAAERARRQAEKAAERARRQAEKAAATRRAPGFRFTWGGPPPEPPSKVEPVSEEERLTILRMLEQKKISAAEAAKLLEALEGKEP